MSLTDCNLRTISVHAVKTLFHIPPATWKGDPTGHIGSNDVFFYVLEGEVILFIDSRYYCVKSGQMVFLPKGKLRKYTQVSDSFTMYESRFSASVDGENLMKVLGACNNNYVITVPDTEKMTELFINSHREEMNRDYIFDVTWSANILNIIKIYIEESRKQSLRLQKDIPVFEELISFMQNNLDKNITIEDLTNIAHIEATYLIRKFKKIYGTPPLAYFGNMRYQKAIEMLINTTYSIENIAKFIGINDVAYFSRWFKKIGKLSPTEYRRLFIR